MELGHVSGLDRMACHKGLLEEEEEEQEKERYDRT